LQQQVLGKPQFGKPPVNVRDILMYTSFGLHAHLHFLKYYHK